MQFSMRNALVKSFANKGLIKMQNGLSKRNSAFYLVRGHDIRSVEEI